MGGEKFEQVSGGSFLGSRTLKIPAKVQVFQLRFLSTFQTILWAVFLRRFSSALADVRRLALTLHVPGDFGPGNIDCTLSLTFGNESGILKHGLPCGRFPWIRPGPLHLRQSNHTRQKITRRGSVLIPFPDDNRTNGWGRCSSAPSPPCRGGRGVRMPWTFVPSPDATLGDGDGAAQRAIPTIAPFLSGNWYETVPDEAL